MKGGERGAGRGGTYWVHSAYIAYCVCSYSPLHSHSFSLEWLWNHISHQKRAQCPISQVVDLMGLVAVGNFRDGLRELVCMLLRLLDLAGVVQLKVTNHTSSVEDGPRALQMVDAAGGGAGGGALV